MFDKMPAYEALLAARRPDGTEPLELYRAVADALARGSGHEVKARASFIRDQCAGFDGRVLFQKYAQRWGFPAGIALADFRRGFLWRFRYQPGAPGAEEALAWFRRSPEAKAARRLECWTAAQGIPECEKVVEGAYPLLVAALPEHGKQA